MVSFPLKIKTFIVEKKAKVQKSTNKKTIFKCPEGSTGNIWFITLDPFKVYVPICA